MIGMPFGKKSPKSELHEFYQLHPGNPTFNIQSMSNPPAEPLFLCTLICPAIGITGQSTAVAEQTFSGQGRNKKTAEQYASEKALEHLRQRGLLPPAVPQMPDQQLPLDLQRQLAGTSRDTSPLHKLQAQELSQGLSPPLQEAQALQTPTTPNGGYVEEMNGSAALDYESMTKEELIAKLKQAQKDNLRLKEEVETEHQRRQKAVDFLLGAHS